MKKIIASVAVAAFAALGMTSAHADAPTLVLSGGSATFGLDPAVITATASVPGTVAFSAAGKVIAGCDAVATSAATPFIAKCTWTPAASGATALTAVLTPTDTTLAKVNAPTLNVKVGVPVYVMGESEKGFLVQNSSNYFDKLGGKEDFCVDPIKAAQNMGIQLTTPNNSDYSNIA